MSRTSWYVVWILGCTLLGLAIGTVLTLLVGGNQAWMGAIGAGLGGAFASSEEKRRPGRTDRE